MTSGDIIRKRAEQTVRPMRDEWESIKGSLDEIAKNMYPQARRTINETPEATTHKAESFKEDNILSIIPYEAVRKGAAGFFVNLMNPAQQWVHLENTSVTDENVDGATGKGTASDVIEKLERLVVDTISRSGSYKAAKKMIEHCLVFGFACVLVKEDEECICKAQCLPIGQYSFGVDADGQVNRVERRFAMTAEELVREFGGGSNGRDALPPDVITAWKTGVKGNDANYVVRNLIEPNERAYEVGTDNVIDYGLPKKMKYRSIYWLEGRSGVDGYKGILAVRGFEYKPIVTPRFDCELGSIYGRGKGQDALNACRGLQALKYDELEISSNRAEPALIVSEEFQESGFGANRGQINYANIGERASALAMPVIPNPPTSEETRTAAMEFQQEIRAAFFNDEFATIDSLKTIAPGDKRTAAEINALKSENLLQLGGATMMFDHEGITPFVNLFVYFVMKSKKWREMSKGIKLDSRQLMPRYVSSLFVAQRMQEVNSLDAAVNVAISLAQSQDTEAMRGMKMIDFDRYFRQRHKLIGANESILRSEDEVAEMEEQERAAQEQAAMMAQQQAEADKQLTEAKAIAQLNRNSGGAGQVQPEPGVDSLANGMGGMSRQFGGYAQ